MSPSSPDPSLGPSHDPAHGHDPNVHVYDDIVEMDNPLPRWWLLTFFGTIVFSAVYFYHFEVFKTGPSPDQELAAEQLAEAKARLASGKVDAASPEALLAMAHDDTAIREGAATFQQLCASCHGDLAEGKIGPNLTDAYWLHGSKPEAIYSTISKGFPDKGMPAWESSLGPRKTQVVAAFVLSLKGKNVPGKAPQGEPDQGNLPWLATTPRPRSIRSLRCRPMVRAR